MIYNEATNGSDSINHLSRLPAPLWFKWPTCLPVTRMCLHLLAQMTAGGLAVRRIASVVRTRRASKPHNFHSLARRCRVRRYWQYWPRAGPCNGDGLRPVHVTLWFKECHLARLSSHCWYGRACGCRITMTTMEAGGPNRMKNAGRSNVVAHLFVNKHRDPLFYYWRSTGQINLKILQSK